MRDLPFSIRFKPEGKDYVHASRALAKNSTSFIVMAAFLVIAMVASLVVLLVPSIGGPAWFNTARIFLVVGLFYIIYFFAVIPWQLKRAYKKNDYLHNEREFIFKDKSIQIKVGEGGTELGLETLQKVFDDKDFFLMLFKGKQSMYFFIPRRAFDETVREEDFLAYMKENSITIK